MKKSGLLAILLAITSVAAVPTQAAVYGTLKEDMTFITTNDVEVSKSTGDVLNIVGEDEDNYIILINGEEEDLIDKELVKVENVITKTKQEEVKVYTEASTDSDVLLTLKNEELVMVLEKDEDFYQVKYNDTIGYVRENDIENQKLSEAGSYDNTVGEQVVEVAKQYLGGRYVYGGTSLATGVDCSGFTQQILKKFNVNLARNSASQYATNGVKVAISDLQPGDLVFYGYNGRVSHVAIYAGNNQVVHASTSKTGIVMGKLYQNKPIIGAKRVV